jgi:uncharacterized protein
VSLELHPTINRITIYPVKSLDGISLQKARVGKGGLLHDRQFAIKNSNGKFINGKSNVLIHSLRSKVDLDNKILSLKHETEEVWNHFHLHQERAMINEYLSAFFNEPATLVQDDEGGFMDIPGIAALTVVSKESLEAVSSWFNNMDMEETRKRFRATIEISGVTAFWEDRLFLEEGTAIEFRAGDVTIFGISPRARCVVPTRHPEKGEVIHAFQKTFAVNRAENIPQWSTLDNYHHTYYLTVNCYIPPSESGKFVSIGDEIKIIGRFETSFTSL